MDPTKKYPPCLICGKSLSDDKESGTGTAEDKSDPEADEVVIKEEINEEECFGDVNDVTGENENATVVVAAVAEEEKQYLSSATPCNARTGADEKLLYDWFLKWFKLPETFLNTTKNYKRKRLSNHLGWEVTSGRERFPFCPTCKTQLEGLLELQNRVDELEKEIQSRVQSLKTKSSFDEHKFRNQKDIRHRRVRKQIPLESNGDKSTGSPQVDSNDTDILPGIPTRKSTRTKTTTPSRLASAGKNANKDALHSKTMLPLVMLSTADITSAKQRRPTSSLVEESEDTKPGSLQDMECPEDSDDPIWNQDSNDDPGDDDDDWLDSKKMTKIKTKRIRKTGRTTNKRTTRKKVLKQNKSGKGTRGIKRSIRNSDKHKMTTEKPKKWLRRDEDSDDEDHFLDAVGSRDREPESSPPTGQKRSRRKRKLRDDDDDYAFDKAEEDEREEEDDSGSESESEGEHKSKRLHLDPVKKTLSYKRHVFLQVDPLNEHVFQCSECNEIIEHKDSRIRHHVFRHHSDKFACSQCQFRGVSKTTLKRHIQATHEGGAHHRPVNCRFCDKPSNICRIKLHEWSHKNEEERRLALEAGGDDVPPKMRRKYQCDECGRDFATRVSLDSHKLRIHGTEEEKGNRMELCPECGGTYLELKKHLQSVHVKKKTYTCLEPGCGLTVTGLAQMTKHKNAVHRKIRPFKCTQCPRDFTHQKNLQHHLNLHLGIRPWQCEHCSSAFTTKSQVQRHMKSYHTEGVAPPKRKSYTRGPTMLGADIRKKELVSEGKYLPPSALATWAAGREPTSHFLTSPSSDVTGTDDGS